MAGDESPETAENLAELVQKVSPQMPGDLAALLHRAPPKLPKLRPGDLRDGVSGVAPVWWRVNCFESPHRTSSEGEPAGPRSARR